MTPRVLETVYDCPKCGGTGRWHEPPCEHDWRLVQSFGGPSSNLQLYACQNEDCEATLCSDCADEGLETCPEPKERAR